MDEIYDGKTEPRRYLFTLKIDTFFVMIETASTTYVVIFKHNIPISIL